jgi:hypothetical protein
MAYPCSRPLMDSDRSYPKSSATSRTEQLTAETPQSATTIGYRHVVVVARGLLWWVHSLTSRARVSELRVLVKSDAVTKQQHQQPPMLTNRRHPPYYTLCAFRSHKNTRKKNSGQSHRTVRCSNRIECRLRMSGNGGLGSTCSKLTTALLGREDTSH